MSSILLTESTNMEYITQNGFDYYFFVFLYASRLKLHDDVLYSDYIFLLQNLILGWSRRIIMPRTCRLDQKQGITDHLGGGVLTKETSGSMIQLWETTVDSLCCFIEENKQVALWYSFKKPRLAFFGNRVWSEADD